jgi:hypothetical protein
MIAIEQRRGPQTRGQNKLQSVRLIRTDRIAVSVPNGGRRTVLVLRHRPARLAAASGDSR